jgi:hypothetical protein
MAKGGVEKAVAVIVMWGVVVLFLAAVVRGVSTGGMDAVRRDLEQRVKAGWGGGN